MKRSKRLKAKRRSRAFYRRRRAAKAKADVLPQDEAEALSAWRGFGVALAVLALAALAMFAAALAVR